MTSNNNKKEKKMKMQLAQSTILHSNLRIIDIHNRQVVINKESHKVIGYASKGKFCQDPLVVRTLQNSYDLQRVWGLG
jgi:hypothetical protein